EGLPGDVPEPPRRREPPAGRRGHQGAGDNAASGRPSDGKPHRFACLRSSAASTNVAGRLQLRDNATMDRPGPVDGTTLPTSAGTTWREPDFFVIVGPGDRDYRGHFMGAKLLIERASWTLVDQGVVSAGNFLLNVLLARTLSEADYGKFVLFL